MPLATGKPVFKATIKQMILDRAANLDETVTVEEASEIFSEIFANAIIALIKTGLVTTAGSASAQTGNIT